MHENINKLKKELGMYGPDEMSVSTHLIRPLVSKSLPNRIINKIRRELSKKKAFSKLNLSSPSPLTIIKARKICEELTFSAPSKPKVSIVIPVFNKFELTVGCLQSLEENIPKYIKVEVIIVDNNSTDDSKDYLNKVKGAVYIRNKENLGFVEACNKGADKTKGKYIVFLNNDTSIAKGWLEHLLGTIECDDSIGMVGSKLVFPSGHLQEAGGIIFSDGSGMNYGKHDNPADYKYNYMRDVDYCSAASVIISKKLFKNIGCFDKLYAPAYYEDTDLAFSVRKQGLRVVYQPLSVAFHIEGATAGTSTSSGFKRYQDINHKKFVKKWKTVLKDQKQPHESYLARDRKADKLALIVDEHVPRPDEDSGSVRMYRIIEALQKLGYKVTFFPNYTGYIGKHVMNLQQKGVEVVYGNVKFRDFIKEHGQYYETIILSRPRIASYYLDACRVYCQNAKLLYDTVDLHYLRMQRQAEFEPPKNKDKIIDIANKYEVIEKHLMKQADHTFVVSSAELKLLEADGVDNISILSNIHEPVPGAYENTYNDRKDLLFVGGYAHQPNIDAVRWFTESIFPKIISKDSSIKLHIVGSRMPKDLQEFLKDKRGVVNHGFVEDLEPLLNKSRVFIAPLRYGAGVKGKIGQAIEYGIPVVSTKIGVEGMYLKHEKSCLEAEDEDVFASEVLRLYNNKDLWDSIRIEAKKSLELHFSGNAAKNNLAKVLNR